MTAPTNPATQKVTVRLDLAALELAETLAPKLKAAQPDLRCMTIGRLDVLRMAMLRGLESLAAELSSVGQGAEAPPASRKRGGAR